MLEITEEEFMFPVPGIEIRIRNDGEAVFEAFKYYGLYILAQWKNVHDLSLEKYLQSVSDLDSEIKQIIDLETFEHDNTVDIIFYGVNGDKKFGAESYLTDENYKGNLREKLEKMIKEYDPSNDAIKNPKFNILHLNLPYGDFSFIGNQEDGYNSIWSPNGGHISTVYDFDSEAFEVVPSLLKLFSETSQYSGDITIEMQEKIEKFYTQNLGEPILE